MIFPDVTPANVTTAFLRAYKEARIVNFRFHDLRHNFASYLTMKAYPLVTVQRLLVHRDIRMTLRYSHLSKTHWKKATLSIASSLRSNYLMDTIKTLRIKKELAASPVP